MTTPPGRRRGRRRRDPSVDGAGTRPRRHPPHRRHQRHPDALRPGGRRTAGRAAPRLPQTCFAWRKQVRALRERFTLVTDLRGHGDTDKPATGYDKRTTADDVRQLMGHLDHQRVAMVGHDRGARVFNQVEHLPEALIAGREEIWLRYFFGAWSYNPQMLTDDEVAVYAKAPHMA